MRGSVAGSGVGEEVGHHAVETVGVLHEHEVVAPLIPAKQFEAGAGGLLGRPLGGGHGNEGGFPGDVEAGPIDSRQNVPPVGQDV